MEEKLRNYIIKLIVALKHKSELNFQPETQYLIKQAGKRDNVLLKGIYYSLKDNIKNNEIREIEIPDDNNELLLFILGGLQNELYN